MPYFERQGPTTFVPTDHVRGAWGPEEQHVGPSLGLLTHLVETHRDARRDDALVLARLSFDLLGLMSMDPVEAEVEVLRPGRTVELVEARLVQDGRAAVRLRAWLLQGGDTTAYAGHAHAPMPAVETLEPWDPRGLWPSGFIASAEVRRDLDRPGRGLSWVRSEVPLLAEEVSPTAHAARLLDIANGMAARVDPGAVAYPNVDLTAHLFRTPTRGWLGFDTTVSFGPAGMGLTSSVLHDVTGPFGTLAQILTLRPR